MSLLKTVAACMLAASLAACASAGNGQVKTLTPEDAAAMLAGKDKAEVRRQLGEAEVIEFPSGQAVWIYQTTDSAAQFVKYVPLLGRMTATGARIKELKILIGQDGRVKKILLQDIHAQ